MVIRWLPYVRTDNLVTATFRNPMGAFYTITRLFYYSPSRRIVAHQEDDTGEMVLLRVGSGVFPST